MHAPACLADLLLMCCRAVVKPQDAAKIATDQLKDAAFKLNLEIQGVKSNPPVKLTKPAAPATNADQMMKGQESTKSARPIRTAVAQPAVNAWHRSGSIASIVRSSSPAQTGSDAGSFRSETPRSLVQDEGTPKQHQLNQDGKALLQTGAAGAKDGQVQAASPITPNAIKAFQPDQLLESSIDIDPPLAIVSGAQNDLVYDSHKSSSDGNSICSDEVSDALFVIDPGGASEGATLG